MNEDGQELCSYEDETGKMGFKDVNGKIIIPAIWDWVGDYHEGFAAVSDEKDQFGFIDTTGNNVIPCKWDSCGYFSEGLAFVEKEGKFGYVNRQGDIVIPLIWSGAYPFYNGRAIVFDNSQRYIDKLGNVIWTRKRTAPKMIKISETCEMDINDMLFINSIEELGEVDTFEEFFKYTDDALNGH